MSRFFLILVFMWLSFLSANAQSLSDLFKANKDKVEAIVEKSTGFSLFNLKGDWKYTGVAVELNSDDPLMVLGGTAIQDKIETRLDKELQSRKISMQTIVLSFDGQENFSVLNTQNKRKVNGHYSYDKDKKVITLSVPKTKANVPLFISGTTSTLQLMCSADKLIDLTETLGKKVEKDSNIGLILKVASQFDGMKIGLKLKKQ
ncbi:MAG TPA: DUF4923 family protein [Bacteroidaceae bacterium]|mgnify:CR=1 FL=1|nr:DUF4923 family protein [Bacteroidaceae bacterium]